MKREGGAAAVMIALGILSAIAAPLRADGLGSSPGADPFALCRAQLAQHPDDFESAYCFSETAAKRRLWDEGVRVFASLIREHPHNFWLPLAYGHLYRSRVPHADLDATEEMYRRAANGFEAARQAEGEILARSNLRDILVPRGRVAEATREVARVTEIGGAATDPLLKARAWSLEATHIIDTGGDLGLAYRLLKQTERTIFPSGPYRLRRTCLGSLGLVAFRTGRLDEALALFRQLDALARAEMDADTAATAQYNILNTESMKATLLPTTDSRQRLTQLARETLATGSAAGHRGVMVKTHQALAELMAADAGSRLEALQHAERCLALATDARQPQDEAVCSWLIASILQADAPAKAKAAQVRALDATARAHKPLTDAMSARRHMRFSWLSKPRHDAIRDSLAAIDAIETFRGLQETADSMAALFTTWTLDYYWFSGRLLQDAQDGDQELAFSVTERLRARTLLEIRQRSRTRPDPANPAISERQAVLRDIASVQRTLMDPRFGAGERHTLLQTLEVLEAREEEAERTIAMSTATRNRPTPAFASLHAVQSALTSNEALLSFQIGIGKTYEGEFGGGSWLIVVTRDRRAVYAIPDRSYFAPQVPVFAGLLGRGDGVEIPAAVRLYRDVFSTAIEELPRGVDRLILVPDGPLQQLPFDALRADARAKPLAVRYQLEVTPSATLWLDWRRNPVSPAKRRALGLADPELTAGVQTVAVDRLAWLERGLEAGRLPHARRESRALARHLGNVEALVGPRASEHAIKTRYLRDYDIVHVAAHAVADERYPERSAVFLAPGAESEDGLLQAREIADLDLEGRMVVLSACQTASGAILSGEGVMSLARAFFEAGARTVIGTRWPVRDDDAAWFFEAFYRELGKGASAAEALARTKATAIDAGLRPDVWAGVVLLGDGALRPFPNTGSKPSFTSSTLYAIVVVAVLALGAIRAASVILSR
jgi:tetratricopeptide (TPR) repeat protein